jgi:hypothetical protein
MTKTEKRRRARKVRFALSRFIDLQDNDLREYRRSQGVDPDHAEFSWIREAKTEMDQLYTQMLNEVEQK